LSLARKQARIFVQAREACQAKKPAAQTTETSMSTIETGLVAFIAIVIILGYLRAAEWMDEFCHRHRWLP